MAAPASSANGIAYDALACVALAITGCELSVGKRRSDHIIASRHGNDLRFAPPHLQNDIVPLDYRL